MDLTNQLVYTVFCVEKGGQVVHHIFSTMEKAQTFAGNDPRPCVISDYVIDVPERKEMRPG